MGALLTTSSLGGELVSFKIDGIEKIHQGREVRDAQGRVYSPYHAPVLFPIVGKLKRNQMIVNGRTFEILPDGFAKDMEFEPVTKLDNFHSYVLRSNKYTMARYPFDFELYNTYMQEETKLVFLYKIINTGNNNMPCAIGSAPAFKIDEDDLKQGNYYLEFEDEEEKAHFLYSIDGLIGTEYAKNILENNKRINLDSNTFSDGILIIKGIQNKKISLRNRRTQKKVLTLNYEGWPYLAIWSREGAPFISLEPWMSTADRVSASNILIQKPDMVTLQPGEKFENRFSVEFFS